MKLEARDFAHMASNHTGIEVFILSGFDQNWSKIDSIQKRRKSFGGILINDKLLLHFYSSFEKRPLLLSETHILKCQKLTKGKQENRKIGGKNRVCIYCQKNFECNSKLLSKTPKQLHQFTFILDKERITEFNRHKSRCKAQLQKMKKAIFSCSHCDKRVDTQEKLDRHVAICAMGNTIADTATEDCPYCFRKFPTQSKTLSRVYFAHKTSCKRKNCPDLYVYTCSFCGRKLQSEINLKAHEDKCLANPIFKNRDSCTKCGSKFKCLMSMKRHLRECNPVSINLQSTYHRVLKMF